LNPTPVDFHRKVSSIAGDIRSQSLEGIEERTHGSLAKAGCPIDSKSSGNTGEESHNQPGAGPRIAEIDVGHLDSASRPDDDLVPPAQRPARLFEGCREQSGVLAIERSADPTAVRSSSDHQGAVGQTLGCRHLDGAAEFTKRSRQPSGIHQTTATTPVLETDFADRFGSILTIHPF
jgi:hypothetical protein